MRWMEFGKNLNEIQNSQNNHQKIPKIYSFDRRDYLLKITITQFIVN